MNLVIFMKEQQLDALLENINYEISLLSNAFNTRNFIKITKIN